MGTPEYMKKYNARPEQVNNREKRNLARAHAIKDGKVSKGDGKDIDHKKPLITGGGNSKSNQAVVDKSTNRGWRKGKSGYTPS